jgi:tetratricopeptide (TPR) repeat protein
MSLKASPRNCKKLSVVATISELFTLGLQNLTAGDLQAAERLYVQIVRANPAHAEAHCNLGLALAGQGKLNEAVHHFRQAVHLQPNFTAAHNNLGTALRSQGHWKEAIQCFQQALKLDPRFGDAHYNLGNALKDRGQLEEAVDHYHQALRLNPNNANIYNNLGTVLQNQRKLDEAVSHYQQALQINPNHAEAHRNLGTTLQAQGKLAPALEHYQKAIRIRPEFAEPRHDLALLQLLLGDFERGWPEYEWRFRVPGLGRPRHFSQPLWDGAALDHQTVLLHAEQGLGDTMQFVRYLPLVKRSRGKVIVECQPSLLPLLGNAAGMDRLVARGSPLPPFDCHAPLLSLPRILNTSATNVPGPVPYLHADATLIEHWNRPMSDLRLDNGRRMSHFLVGIAWQGNPAFRGDHQRSIPLSHFAGLASADGVRLVSLQKGPGTEQLTGNHIKRIANLDDAAGPFMDTAAIMMHLDLVICSDSAVAHLAGALGVPVWLALPLVPDWRWLLSREDSPWYPTMRLFRQTRAGRCDEVFARIAEELKRVLRQQQAEPEA